MSQSRQTKEYRTFVKGLNTESSPLTFPEDTSKDEDNFVLNRNGTRQRRLGIDYESTDTFGTIASGDEVSNAFTTHRWDNVNNQGELTYLCIQNGSTLTVHELSTGSTVGAIVATFELETATDNDDSTRYVRSSGKWTTIKDDPLESTVGNGVIAFTGKSTEPFYLKYEDDTPTITIHVINIRIRDTLGITAYKTDGTELDVDEFVEAPSKGSLANLSVTHQYSLYNQGWQSDKIARFAKIKYDINLGDDADTDPEKKYYYPTLTMVMSDAYVAGTADTGKSSTRWVFKNLIAKADAYGKTVAPRGKYIISAFNRSQGRYDASGITGTGIPEDTEQYRPQRICYHAGRVFYGGIPSSNTNTGVSASNGWIFFSKVLDRLKYMGECFQDVDPTASTINEPVVTDGGLIVIPEIHQLMRMVSLGSSLVLLGSNGIWEIKGGEFGFTPMDFFIRKISSVGCMSSHSVVESEDNIFYFAQSGIYMITKDQVSGDHQAVNITESTIQTLYNDIPTVKKLYAQGIYDAPAKTVRWIYGEDEGDTYTNRYKYTRQLNLDLVLKAFYTFTFGELDTDSPFIAGWFKSPTLNRVTYDYFVLDDNGEYVSTPSGDLVVAEIPKLENNPSEIKYLTIDPSVLKYRFSTLSETTFYDWKSADTIGVDALAYLWTGWEGFGDTLRPKQVVYLIMHFENTETDADISGDPTVVPSNPSSCLVQARWDFTNSANSGKWFPKSNTAYPSATQPIDPGTLGFFQAYRKPRVYTPTSSVIAEGYEVVTTKSKLRGKGRNLSLYIQTEPGKDCRLLGWGLDAVGYSVI